MDFDLSEEQRLLRDSVQRLIADRYDFEERKRHAAEPEGWSRAMWRQYAELGLLGVPFAEGEGGFGGGPIEMMIVSEAFGRGLVLEPYLATVVLAGGALRHAGNAGLRAELAPRIAAGELLLALAHAERQSRYDLADVGTSAKQEGGSWVLNGAKTLVLHGDAADKLVVSARVAGGRRDREGIGLFLVDAGAPGVSRRGYPTQDRMRAAEITLDGARAEAVLGTPGDALPAIERTVDEAIASLCAEAVGCMEATHELTVEYLKTRRQFGRAIGEFQALQHRAADMYMALEQARSMAIYAAMMVADPDASERSRAMSAAKVQIGRSARHIGQEAVQLHGGVGVTMEYKVGHYFKRMTMIDVLFGNADLHLARLAQAGGLIATEREAA